MSMIIENNCRNVCFIYADSIRFELEGKQAVLQKLNCSAKKDLPMK